MKLDKRYKNTFISIAINLLLTMILWLWIYDYEYENLAISIFVVLIFFAAFGLGILALTLKLFKQIKDKTIFIYNFIGTLNIIISIVLFIYIYSDAKQITVGQLIMCLLSLIIGVIIFLDIYGFKKVNQ